MKENLMSILRLLASALICYVIFSFLFWDILWIKDKSFIFYRILYLLATVGSLIMISDIDKKIEQKLNNRNKDQGMPY